MQNNPIQVKGLQKSYKQLQVLKDVDFEAFKAHGSSAYFQEAAQKFEDLLEGKIQVKFLKEV